MNGTAGHQLELDLQSVGRYVSKSVNPPSDGPPHTDLPTYRLTDRLRAAGLPRETQIIGHANHRVLVSLTVGGALRVHLGHAFAPEDVLVAIVRWARPRAGRAERLAAQRILVAFPVQEHVPPEAAKHRRPPRPRPGDERLFVRLHELHCALNERHFAGALGKVRMALSTRMRRRLGEFRLAAVGCHEIVIGRRHLSRDGWAGVAETLGHEMVHQWQAETGRRLNHGAEFRKRWAAVRTGGNSEQ